MHGGAREMTRDIAETDAYATSRPERKKVEMLFAHLKRITRLDRLRLRGPNGARDEFHLAATAQNLRKLAKLLSNDRSPGPHERGALDRINPAPPKARRNTPPGDDWVIALA